MFVHNICAYTDLYYLLFVKNYQIQNIRTENAQLGKTSNKPVYSLQYLAIPGSHTYLYP